MVSVLNEQKEIERIFEDVAGLRDRLGFENSSSAYVESPEQFLKTAPPYGGIDKGTWAYINESDLRIHLNTLDAGEKKFRPLSASFTAFFQPYASFLENTEMGSKLRIGMKSFYQSGEMSKGIKELYEQTEKLFRGIGKWTELKINARLQKEKGYDFSEVEEMIMQDFDKSRDVGFQLCDKLWEMAKSNSRLEDRHKIVSNVIRNIGGKKEGNLTLIFQDFVGGLESGSINIFKIGMPAQARGVPLDVQTIEPDYNALNICFTQNDDFRHYKPSWERLNNGLKKFGQTELHKTSLSLYQHFSTNLQNHQKLSDWKGEEKERREREFKDLLHEIGTFIENWKKKTTEVYSSKELS
jgi:hypothetical protein